ncbi:hypothetical protein Bca4012_036146 [Brassica carinata]
MFTSNQIVLVKRILLVTDSSTSTSQKIESKDNELFKSAYQSKNECKRWQSKITELQKNYISDVVYGTYIYSFSQSHNGCHC